MCGIAGFSIPRGLSPGERRRRYEQTTRRMAAALRHRGPDEQTVMLLDGAALGHARLAIIDLSGGRQPMRDEATGVTVVFNGEIFNYIELREQLKDRYDFKTVSDTEVIIAAYMLHGIDGVRDFVGQFAFAIFDPRDGALHLARDHTGIQPLYFAPLRGANHKNHDGARPDGGLAFASEVKALFAGGHVVPAFDEVGLAQIYTLWAPVEPRTAFAGVSSLPAGCVATFKDGALDVRRYWDLPMDLAPSTMMLRPRPACGTSSTTPSACACAPTCRWAPTSPVASTAPSCVRLHNGSSAARCTRSRCRSPTRSSTRAASSSRWPAPCTRPTTSPTSATRRSAPSCPAWCATPSSRRCVRRPHRSCSCRASCATTA
jgi:hypothetical protein